MSEQDKKTAEDAANISAADQIEQANPTPEAEETQEKRLKPISWGNLSKMPIPKRSFLLSGAIPESSITWITAKRGIGKTHMALELAAAIASGKAFHTWQAPKPRKVLYLDGEMNLSDLKDRITAIEARLNTLLLSENVLFMTPEASDESICPDLGTEEGRRKLDPLIEEAEVIVLDNLSCLVYGVNENDAEEWEPIQRWLLRQRAKGKSFIWLHHTGKDGTTRGTSKREDSADTVIKLSHSDAFDEADGACFKVSFEKSRASYGPEIAEFHAQLSNGNWRFIAGTASKKAAAQALMAQGMSQNQAAKQVGISSSTLSKGKKKKPTFKLSDQPKLSGGS